MNARFGSHALFHVLPVQSTLDDIVAAKSSLSQLGGIVRAAQGREAEAGGGKSPRGPNAGVVALFHGPSGPDKLLAAEAIAGTLRVPLHRVDLGSGVGKYIAETEKNLAAVFDDAECHHAVLYFDEADALFGKRTEVKDANDRYANVEVSYLLRKMDAYEGVVILATSGEWPIDEALLRRSKFTVAFPLPQAG